MTTLRIFIVVLTVSAWATAQNKKHSFQEGYIRYSIGIEGVSDDLSSFAQSSSLSLYFKDDYNKAELAILAGVGKMQLINLPQETQCSSVLLMDIPTVSEKTLVDLEQSQVSLFSVFSAENEQSNRAPQVPRLHVQRGKTLRVAGYRCHRVEVHTQSTYPIVLYVSRKLSPGSGTQFFPWQEYLDGFPLYIEMVLEGATIRLIAKDIEKAALRSSIFEVPTDYNRQDMDEFKYDMSDKLGLGGRESKRFGL